MPTQSALGAGVLQTSMRLSVSLGLAITTAGYSSSISTPEAHKDVTFAFGRAYICSIAFAAIGLIFVPFMRIGKQGSPVVENEKHEDLVAIETAASRPQSRNYRDNGSQTQDSYMGSFLSSTASNSSLTSHLTQGTYGSQASYFPRWSWENESDHRDQRDFEEQVTYEICIKCSKSRKVNVQRDSYRNAPIIEPRYEYTLTPVVGGSSYLTYDSSYHDLNSD